MSCLSTQTVVIRTWTKDGQKKKAALDALILTIKDQRTISGTLLYLLGLVGWLVSTCVGFILGERLFADYMLQTGLGVCSFFFGAFFLLLLGEMGERRDVMAWLRRNGDDLRRVFLGDRRFMDALSELDRFTFDRLNRLAGF